MPRRKYNNEKEVVDGITFDSKKEAKYYRDLSILKRVGEVLLIECHPTFLLQPGFWKCCGRKYLVSPAKGKCPMCGEKAKKYQQITYTADFRVFYSDGRVEVVDVKGVETKEFKIKRKMFEFTFSPETLKVV